MFSYVVLRAVASVTVRRTVYVPAVVYACGASLLAEGPVEVVSPQFHAYVAMSPSGSEAKPEKLMVWLMRGWAGSANHEAFVGGAPEVAIARQP